MEKLLSYAWPGNIRELKNVIERAVFLCESDKIAENDISLPELHSGTESGKRVQNLTPECINRVLSECHGNVSMAARQLGVSRVTLYRKMKKYNLE
jgi:transcriptional regulator of acetoin/glycerol metabolism